MQGDDPQALASPRPKSSPDAQAIHIAQHGVVIVLFSQEVIPLSDAAKDRVAALFPAEDDRSEVCRYLELECGDNLPMIDSDYIELAERVRFAVLKLSQGSMPHLKKSIDGAKVEWRDTLMMAGFGEDVKAHLTWNPS